MSHKDKRETLQQDLEKAAWSELHGDMEPLMEQEAPPQDLEGAEGAASIEPTAQADALAAATAQAEEYLALAQRVQADFENFRKRNEKVRADAYLEGKREVISAMLPVLDNLERAVQAAANAPEEGIRSGVEMVLRQLQDIYTSQGVTPIDRAGEKFDPNLEDAVMQGAPDEGEPGTVCQVLQKGYAMGNMVLRHAMVKVVPD